MQTVEALNKASCSGTAHGIGRITRGAAGQLPFAGEAAAYLQLVGVQAEQRQNGWGDLGGGHSIGDRGAGVEKEWSLDHNGHLDIIICRTQRRNKFKSEI